jgi:hypothetical protein
MVLHLSTFHLEGGAGVAATRLHRALQKSGTDSRMLVPSLKSPEENASELAVTSWECAQKLGTVCGRKAVLPTSGKGQQQSDLHSLPPKVGADISDSSAGTGRPTYSAFTLDQLRFSVD